MGKFFETDESTDFDEVINGRSWYAKFVPSGEKRWDIRYYCRPLEVVEPEPEPRKVLQPDDKWHGMGGSCSYLCLNVKVEQECLSCHGPILAYTDAVKRSVLRPGAPKRWGTEYYHPTCFCETFDFERA